MTRIVVLGDVMVDVVARLEGPLAPGSDAPAGIAFRGGGSAANVAAWAAAAGGRALLVGRVGADDRGRWAEAELRRAGVETSLVVDPERPTGTCVVLVAPDGERSMVPDPGANDGLAAADLPDSVPAGGGHLHVAGYALLREGSGAAARYAIERALAGGMTVSVDPSSAALLTPAFLGRVEGVGLLLPNTDEAAALTGEANPEHAARRLAERVPEVVVTLGAEGALWSDGREVVRAEAASGPAGAASGPAGVAGAGLDTTGDGLDTTGAGIDTTGAVIDTTGAVLDTTGAGDAFAAGLLCARLGGAGPRAALVAGCRLAAEAVRTPGGRPVSR